MRNSAKKNSWFLLFVMLGSLLPIPSSYAIYNGIELSSYEFLVPIKSSRGTCTGSLIAPRIVITAAHCVVIYGKANNPSDIKILGRGLNGNSGKIVSQGYSIFYEENYYNNNSQIEPNDIALIVLEKEIESTKLIRIPDPELLDTIISSRRPLKIYGFGANTAGGSSTLTPRSTTVNFKDETVTLAGFDGYESSFILLTNDQVGAACSGDSGGPIVYEYSGINYLIAIISGAIGPCTRGSNSNDWRLIGSLYNSQLNLYVQAEKVAAELKLKEAAADKAAADKAATPTPTPRRSATPTPTPRSSATPTSTPKATSSRMPAELDKEYSAMYLEVCKIHNDFKALLNGFDYVRNQKYFEVHQDQYKSLLRARDCIKNPATYGPSGRSQADFDSLIKLLEGDGELMGLRLAWEKASEGVLSFGEKKKPIVKATTITCLKGKSSLKVIGRNPVCPSGYKKKA